MYYIGNGTLEYYESHTTFCNWIHAGSCFEHLAETGIYLDRDKSDERQYRAENGTCIFSADDWLTLLGLVKTYEVRGTDWKPSD